MLKFDKVFRRLHAAKSTMTMTNWINLCRGGCQRLKRLGLHLNDLNQLSSQLLLQLDEEFFDERLFITENASADCDPFLPTLLHIELHPTEMPKVQCWDQTFAI